MELAPVGTKTTGGGIKEVLLEGVDGIRGVGVVITLVEIGTTVVWEPVVIIKVVSYICNTVGSKNLFVKLVIIL